MEHHRLITASENLSDWECEGKPLAPLGNLQLKSIDELFAHCKSKKISDCLIQDEVRHSHELQSPSESSNDNNKACILSEMNSIKNSKELQSWFTRIESQILEDNDVLYREYISELVKYYEQYVSILEDVTVALQHLDSLQEQYVFVSDKTNALHEACEHLLMEQTKLVTSAEDISHKLCYFNELDAISQKLNSATLTVVHESFVPLLARLDECIAYIESNPHFKEADSYLVCFRRLLSQALGMVQSYVVSTLQQTTQQLLPKRDSNLPSENAFTLFYGKFRTHAPRIHALMSQIEERVEKDSRYQQLLSDCHQCYFVQRKLLLGPSVTMAINSLAENHQRDNCALVRSGCAFLVHVCEDETQLFYQFFSFSADQLEEFLEHLCTRLYDVLRPIIIHTSHLETLAELCSILKIEMLQEHLQTNSVGLKAFERITKQMLEDVQERLVYRTHVYIQTDILNYNPAPGDLAYPDKLEMMKSIAESLSQNNVEEFNSQALDLPSEISPATCSSIQKQSLEDLESDRSSNKSVSSFKQKKSYSPADLHGMWYPTVRRTLVCLSKLYRCLDHAIFQGLSQEVLLVSIQSLVSASKSIRQNKSALDGQLFLIKHLLILREQIAPFQVEFSINETFLDFSKMKSAAYSLFQKKAYLFSLNSNNSLLEFLFQGAPQVKKNVVDSKKAVDNQLKISCEEFIQNSIEMLTAPLQAFLNKVAMLDAQAKESNQQISLKEQPFASAENVAEVINASYKQLKNNVPILLNKMSLYLANSDTESILFKPVKLHVQNSYEQLSELIRKNYTEEEIIIMGCPSIQQINVLLAWLHG